MDVQLTGTDAQETVDDVAASVLATLYAAVTGLWPRGLRAYHEDDALLVLLRFDRSLLEDETGRFDPLIHVSLQAMPELVAEAVYGRTGRRVLPGTLSISAERGLAAFAFIVLEDAAVEDLLEAGSELPLTD